MIALVCVSQFVWSFTVTVNLVLSESIKQVTAPERLLGQVSSVERIIALAAEPIGALAGGPFADMIGMIAESFAPGNRCRLLSCVGSNFATAFDISRETS